MNTKTIRNIYNIYMRQRVPILDPVCIHGLKTRLGTVLNIYHNEHNTAIIEMDTHVDICVIEKMFYYMKQIKMWREAIHKYLWNNKRYTNRNRIDNFQSFRNRRDNIIWNK